MSDTTRDARWELQKAVNTLLAGRIACKLYDSVPTKAVFPYVTHADALPDAPLEAREVSGRTIPYILNVWSRSKAGKQECFELIDEIAIAMTTYALSVTGFAVVQVTFLSSSVERLTEEAGNSFRGTITFLIGIAKST